MKLSIKNILEGIFTPELPSQANQHHSPKKSRPVMGYYSPYMDKNADLKVADEVAEETSESENAGEGLGEEFRHKTGPEMSGKSPVAISDLDLDDDNWATGNKNPSLSLGGLDIEEGVGERQKIMPRDGISTLQPFESGLPRDDTKDLEVADIIAKLYKKGDL